MTSCPKWLLCVKIAAKDSPVGKEGTTVVNGIHVDGVGLEIRRPSKLARYTEAKLLKRLTLECLSLWSNSEGLKDLCM
jgi:hypothetical protein